MLKDLTTNAGQGNWSVIGCTCSASLFVYRYYIRKCVSILLAVFLAEVKIGI